MRGLQHPSSGKRALFTRIIIIIPNAGAAAPEFRKASTFHQNHYYYSECGGCSTRVQESEHFSPESLLLFRMRGLQHPSSGKRALFTRIIIIIPNAGAAAPEFRKASTFHQNYYYYSECGG